MLDTLGTFTFHKAHTTENGDREGLGDVDMSTITLLLVSCKLGSNSLGASHNGTRVDDATIYTHATDPCLYIVV